MLNLFNALYFTLVSYVLYSGLRKDPEPNKYVEICMYVAMILTGANLVSMVIAN